MKDYLIDPVISVSIIEYGKSKVMSSPGAEPRVYLFPSNEHLNVLQAIGWQAIYAYCQPARSPSNERRRRGTIISLSGAMAEKQNTKMFEYARRRD